MDDLTPSEDDSHLLVAGAGTTSNQSDEIREKDVWEKAVGRSLELCFGLGFTFRHVGGDTPTLDGFIDKDGRAVIACEITRGSRFEESAFQAELNRVATGPIMPLAPGSGAWIAELSLSTRLKGQTAGRFQRLVDDLNGEKLTSFDPEWYPAKAALRATCSALGVSRIHLMDRDKDFVYRHRELDTHNTWLNPSPDLVATELQEVLNTEWIQDKASHLRDRAGELPAHLVLILGDRFSNSVRATFSGVRGTIETPSTALTLPPGVTVVWLIAVGLWGMSYAGSIGWRVHDVRELLP
ncbi:MAG: hypothetical protein ACYCPT_13525 [Acidimicrobiales bacterium]